MRYFAKRWRGMTLSDHGLARCVRDGPNRVATSRSLVCETEADVFKALGLEYLSPTERNVYDVSNLDADAVTRDRGAG